MTIKYNLTKKEYIDFSVYNSNHSKSDSITICFTIVLILILNLKNIIQENNFNLINILIKLVLEGVILIVIFWIGNNFINKIYISNRLKESKKNYFIGPQSVKLEEDYIETTFIGRIEKIEYKYLHAIKITNQHIYIYDSAISGTIVPISAFESEEQVNTFIKTIKERSDL